MALCCRKPQAQKPASRLGRGSLFHSVALMNTTPAAIAVFAVAVFSSVSMAGQDAYFCESRYQVIVGADGKPDIRFLEAPSAMPTINRFSIDRNTGKKIGGTFGSFKDQASTLHSIGSSSSAFVASWIGPAAYGGVHFDSLRIEEFRQGLRKPFIAQAGGITYTGICE
jgi:hypothetical protein